LDESPTDHLTSYLRATGADVVERPHSGIDYAIDLAASIPGEEQSLGPLLVEVKSGRLKSVTLETAQEQLSEYVLRSRSGLGLLIYDEAPANPRPRRSAPLVFALGVDELLTQLEQAPLGSILKQARNRAVHGM